MTSENSGRRPRGPRTLSPFSVVGTVLGWHAAVLTGWVGWFLVRYPADESCDDVCSVHDRALLAALVAAPAIGLSCLVACALAAAFIRADRRDAGSAGGPLRRARARENLQLATGISWATLFVSLLVYVTALVMYTGLH